jgi:flagellar FliJ protein
MKFRFALDRVLKHRKTVEDLAQRDFQLALAELHAEEDCLLFLENEKRKYYQISFEKQSQGGIQSSILGQISDFIRGQDKRIEFQKEKIKTCSAKVEELRQILLEKAKEYKIIKELKEKKRQSFVREKKQKEASLLDDQNTMRFRMKGQEYE